MTKKMLHATERHRAEFLLPVAHAGSFAFVGLSTGRRHDEAMIVYTGTAMTPAVLQRKAAQAQLAVNADVLAALLQQLPAFKVSTCVRLRPGSEFALEPT